MLPSHMTVRCAAIYVRISDDKAEDAAGVARQEADCRALAERQGWTVGEVYIENDTSAYKRKTVRLPDGSTGLRVIRPAFRQMLDALASGALDAVVGYDLDRIARDPRDLEDLIDVVESRKIPTRAVTGSLDLGNDAGITMARVMVAIANKSSRDSSRRIARKHLELAEQGKTGGGGIRSFGYERDGLTVNPAEAQVLRQIADRLLGGSSLVGVAEWLNDSDVPTVRGGRWQNRSVHAVITKPRVAGLRVHCGEIVGDAVWPGIIDRDTWERLLLVLAARAQGSTNTMQRWLSSLLRCGKCGHPLTGSQQARGRGPRYWCATPRGGCGGIGVDAHKSEAHVEKMLLAYLSRPDIINDLRAITSSQSVDQAREEARADEAQLQELAGLWAARSLTTPEYLRARKDIEERLARSRSLVRAALPGVVRELVAGDVQQAWRRYAPAQRREVARAVLPSGIRVDPSTQGSLKGFDSRRLVPLDWTQDHRDTPEA
jgi:site-specific DNA recombinase